MAIFVLLFGCSGSLLSCDCDLDVAYIILSAICLPRSTICERFCRVIVILKRVHK